MSLTHLGVTFPYSEVEPVSGLYGRVSPTCSFDQSFFSCPNEQFGCIERASTEAQSNDCLYPYPYPVEKLVDGGLGVVVVGGRPSLVFTIVPS